MQFRDRSLGFFDRLHLNECETFRPLVVTVTNYFRILNVPDAVEQVEQITLRGIKREITDVQSGRRNFDRLRLTLGPRLLMLILLGAVATCCG